MNASDTLLVSDLRGAAQQYRTRLAEIALLEARVADLEERLAVAVRAAEDLAEDNKRLETLAAFSIGVPSPDGRTVETPHG